MQPPVKCLLVDDLEENLLALAALLQRDDIKILAARSGVEALDLLLAHDVALIILDVQMPEMDGFELAELIRGSERTRHVPLMFVTAGNRDEHRIFKGYEAGAVDFLYKPIEPRMLLSKADTFFQLHRQKQQIAQELQQRTETLQMIEMFNAVLGHDLRNPLNAILTSAYVLQRRVDDDMAQDTARRIISSGQRMSRMIEDVLDVSRARLGGGVPLRRESTELLGLVQRVVREHQIACPDRPIELSHVGDLQGNWDAGRLAQVVSNLVGNALQHGDRTAPVQLHLDGKGAEAVYVVVTNRGRIPPELLPHIFEPFRGGAQRAGSGGERLGLGLFIVQEIVRAHEGTVSVRSAEDQRTQFSVLLPRHG
ncbi:MAG TPA: hybrid sensor histidine kinase/response regulator [Steroidobacteraceae bacterium]|jgi:signal transduction histidine kinase|nr:hybrid sensor histidine kinase/response regulator [Steroidobacteraceae bacterium]